MTDEPPIMDETDAERLLKEQIKQQNNMIVSALGYIRAGQSELAAAILEAAKI